MPAALIQIGEFELKDTLRQTANLVTVLIALTVNILASALPLNGQNTGEISDRFQVYFVPAGYVFAIWFFIFVGWIAFAIYQFQPSQKEIRVCGKLGYLFAVSNLFNAAWLFAWHYNLFGLSVLIMLALLGLLIASYLRLDVNRARLADGTLVGGPSLQHLPRLDLRRHGGEHHLVVVFHRVERFRHFSPALGGDHDRCGVRVGFLMTVTRRDAAYVFVLAWSFIGIAVKQAPPRMLPRLPGSAAGVMLFLVAYSLTRRRNA
jgi:hypothetical protein